jgi:histidine triad (HIT) family protein
MDYDDQNVFARILRGDLPADVVYEDDFCLAFRDLDPKAPVHVLLIPKRPIPRAADCTLQDRTALGHLFCIAGEVARQEGCGDAFRLVVNSGEGAGQTVFHLHVHLLGGRDLSWPPG